MRGTGAFGFEVRLFGGFLGVSGAFGALMPTLGLRP